MDTIKTLTVKAASKHTARSTAVEILGERGVKNPVIGAVTDTGTHDIRMPSFHLWKVEYVEQPEADPDENGLGTFVQRVDLTVEVVVYPGKGDVTFNDVTTDDLRAAIEARVRAAVDWNALTVGGNDDPVVSVRAQRGPGGARYFYPGQPREADSQRPIHWTLEDLGIEKAVRA